MAVDLVIDGNASGAEGAMLAAASAMRELVSQLGSVERKTARVTKRTEQVVTKLDLFSGEAEKLNRVSMILGGTFGDVTGGLDDFAQLLKSGVSPLAAWTLGIGAATVATGFLVSGIVDMTRSARDYLDTLEGADAARWAEQRVAVNKASWALDDAAESMSELAVVLTTELSPAIVWGADKFGDFARGLSVVVQLAGDIAAAFSGAASQTLEEAAREALAARMAADEYAEGLLALEDQTSDTTGVIDLLTLAMMQQSDMTHEVSASEKEAAEAFEKAYARRAQVLQQYAQTRAELNIAPNREANAGGDEGTQRETENLLRQQDVRLGNLDVIEREMSGLERVRQRNAEYHEKELEELEEKKAKRRELMLLSVGWAQQVADISFHLADEINEKSAKSEKKRALNEWKISLARASVSTALATVKALAENPYPLNIVAAALTAAAGGVQIGLIASNKPAHTGRYLDPDEVNAAGARVLKSERMAVVTQAGQQQLTEDMLARANAGLPVGGPQAGSGHTPPIVLDDRYRPTRRIATPDPGYGIRR